MAEQASAERRIDVQITNGVADVRLVRADKMNALDMAMFEALVDTGERLAADRSVRAVVLSGEGRAFCAGLDMGRFQSMAGADAAAVKAKNDLRLLTRTHGDANHPQHAVMVWRKIPVPVIAAVHGVALGGGFQLALGADLRYVTPDLKMSIMEIKWGLVPDMGGTVLMRRLARTDIIRELVYTGRVFSGLEAVEFGFATRALDDPRAAALELAREIASKSPDAIRANKRLMQLADSASDAELLMAESVEQSGVMGTPNQREAVTANLEKRAPRFSDPAA